MGMGSLSRGKAAEAWR